MNSLHRNGTITHEHNTNASPEVLTRPRARLTTPQRTKKPLEVLLRAKRARKPRLSIMLRATVIVIMLVIAVVLNRIRELINMIYTLRL